jgi:hypothetical protein
MVDRTQVLTSFREAQKGLPVPPQFFLGGGALASPGYLPFYIFISFPQFQLLKGIRVSLLCSQLYVSPVLLPLRTGIQPTSNHHHLLSH